MIACKVKRVTVARVTPFDSGNKIVMVFLTFQTCSNTPLSNYTFRIRSLADHGEEVETSSTKNSSFFSSEYSILNGMLFFSFLFYNFFYFFILPVCTPINCATINKRCAQKLFNEFAWNSEENLIVNDFSELYGCLEYDAENGESANLMNKKFSSTKNMKVSKLQMHYEYGELLKYRYLRYSMRNGS